CVPRRRQLPSDSLAMCRGTNRYQPTGCSCDRAWRVNSADRRRPAMSKPTVKREPRAPRVVDVKPTDLIESPPAHGGAFTFSYSYSEVTAAGSKACLKSRRARYADGKLSKESFDGEFDRPIYDAAIDQMQRAFAEQASSLVRTFASFFVLPPARHRDRD